MKKKCVECSGTGKIGIYGNVTCYKCKGKGYTEQKPKMKTVGYINLYRSKETGSFLHWSGALYETIKEALIYKDKNKEHFIGKVFIKEKTK